MKTFKISPVGAGIALESIFQIPVKDVGEELAIDQLRRPLAQIRAEHKEELAKAEGLPVISIESMDALDAIDNHEAEIELEEATFEFLKGRLNQLPTSGAKASFKRKLRNQMLSATNGHPEPPKE